MRPIRAELLISYGGVSDRDRLETATEQAAMKSNTRPIGYHSGLLLCRPNGNSVLLHDRHRATSARKLTSSYPAATWPDYDQSTVWQEWPGEIAGRSTPVVIYEWSELVRERTLESRRRWWSWQDSVLPSPAVHQENTPAGMLRARSGSVADLSASHNAVAHSGKRSGLFGGVQ